MPRTSRVALRACVLGFALLLSAPHFAQVADAADVPPQQVPTVDAAGVAFVGSAACAGCHEAQHGFWLESHHRHAMEPMSEASVLGDFDGASFSRAGETLLFHRDGDRYFVRTTAVTGAVTETELLYTFGWAPLQQYLAAGPGGRLQAFDVAWDSEQQRWFALYGDEDAAPGSPLHWTGLLQNWNFTCADCHSTALRRNYDPATDSFATTWSEVTLGCESCHGAGGAHLAWAAQDADAQAADPAKGLSVSFLDSPGAWVFADAAPIAHWQGEAREQPELAVCGPCHALRRVIADAPAADAALLDAYVPSLLDSGLYRPDGRQEAEVYILGSFLQSKMAAAGVTCSDCHDPHSGLLKAEGNALCTQCHRAEVFDAPTHHHHPEGTEAAACVSCHMPADLYMTVDFRRDHGFHVPSAALAQVEGVLDACAGCHEPGIWEQAAAAGWWTGDDRQTDFERAVALALARAQAVGAAPALASLAEDAGQPSIFRATALSLLATNPQPAAMQSLLTALKSADPLLRLGAVRGSVALPLVERYRLLQPLFGDPSRAVRLEVAQVLSQVPLEQLPPGEAAPLSRLFEEMLAAERLFLDRPENQTNIGNHLANQGDAIGAERFYRAALARDPSYVPAYVNLAELQRTAGSESLAAATLRRGLAAVPEAPALHYALGLALHRQGDAAGALAELGEAARLGPENASYAYALALAQRDGQQAAAIETLRAALALHPNDRALLYALVAFLAQDGEIDQARLHARHLAALEPENAEIAELLRKLGG